MSDPLLQLISTGLGLWIRSRCDQVGDLDLTLQGSSLGLMRGRLQGAVLSARDVRFEGLPLHHAEISSGPIQLDLTWVRPGRMLALKQPFQVSGTVSMPGQPLGDALLSERWRELGDWIAEQLMGLKPLGQLRIENDELELVASVAAQRDPIRKRFRLRAEAGTVVLSASDSPETRAVLPMDPAITITDATLGAGLLSLQGHAIVTPE